MNVLFLKLNIAIHFILGTSRVDSMLDLSFPSSLYIADIHRVKVVFFILWLCDINRTVHVLAQVTSLDHVTDALTGMGVFVGFFSRVSQFLFEVLHPDLHVLVLVHHVHLLKVVRDNLSFGSPSLNIRLHQVDSRSLGRYSMNKQYGENEDRGIDG